MASHYPIAAVRVGNSPAASLDSASQAAMKPIPNSCTQSTVLSVTMFVRTFVFLHRVDHLTREERFVSDRGFRVHSTPWPDSIAFRVVARHRCGTEGIADKHCSAHGTLEAKRSSRKGPRQDRTFEDVP